jgi:phosphoenolpyruvate synthase/pyruvate phosphate dikinase
MNGGKGEGLIWLLDNTDIGYKVPEFDIIDTSYYLDFLQGNTGSLQRLCNELALKYKGRNVAVRSSAVLSEDNEQFSGAGIYDTFFVDNLTPELLEEKVKQVYVSVNSSVAVTYRSSAGLGEEQMAVVVQERCNSIFNGVMQSRLHSLKGIVPVSWSRDIGEVVSGGEDVLHAFFRGEGSDPEDYKVVFHSEDITGYDTEEVRDVLIPIIYQLRERYGKEFEAEFCCDLDEYDNEVHMLQIRPLTNVVDKKVTFPDKKPIYSTEYKGFCMGVGEYIGPWVTRKMIIDDCNKPDHYVYIAQKFDQSREKRMPWKYTNYDLLTPNKKAMIITHNLHAGSHAMTLAQEQGILCLGKLEESEVPDFIPKSEYIHVVCDGFSGRVYEATKDEVELFASNIK